MKRKAKQRVMKNILISLLIILGLYYSVFSQETESHKSFMRDQALKVYLDCAYCDMDYFKTYFTTVNYVIERKDADVYILVTAIKNGGGGMEYSLLLIGLNRYSAIVDTVVFNLDANATSESEILILLRLRSISTEHHVMTVLQDLQMVSRRSLPPASATTLLR